jgi:hypothetical protein
MVAVEDFTFYNVLGLFWRFRGTVDPRVTTGLTYKQLGLRPKFLFWLTTKCWVTDRMPSKATWVATRMAFVSCLIYARTCRLRNGYSTGHVDVSYTCYLMEAFMLQRDGLSPGMCAQRGPSSNRRWRFFCRARHDGVSLASTFLISRAVHCERSRCLLCFAGATMPIPLIKVKTYRVTDKGSDPLCRPAAGPL